MRKLNVLFKDFNIFFLEEKQILLMNEIMEQELLALKGQLQEK